MKDIVDRFIAKDADGSLVVVMCIKESRRDNEPDVSSGGDTDTSFQTTAGELLTTSNNISFRVVDTNRFLRRISVERTAQGVLRVRSPSLM